MTKLDIAALRDGARRVGDTAGEDVCNIALGVPGTPRPGILQYMRRGEALELCERAYADAVRGGGSR